MNAKRSKDKADSGLPNPYIAAFNKANTSLWNVTTNCSLLLQWHSMDPYTQPSESGTKSAQQMLFCANDHWQSQIKNPSCYRTSRINENRKTQPTFPNKYMSDLRSQWYRATTTMTFTTERNERKLDYFKKKKKSWLTLKVNVVM